MKATSTVASTLFPVQPIGTGADRESLISYLVRLARAHQVGVRQLLRRVIWPELRLEANALYVPFFRDQARTVNGVGRYARAFSEGLTKLTAIEGLDRLTFLPWQGVIPEVGPGFLAGEVRWCPDCLAEQREQGKESYFPLVWSLEHYRVCLRHRRQLQSQCPWCGKHQHVIPHHPDQSRCTHCFGFLAPEQALANRTQPTEREVRWAQALQSMLIDPPASDTLSHAHLMQVLDAAAARWADGEKKRLSLMLGLGYKAIGSWNCKKQKPAFPALLQIAEALGVTVKGLLTEPLPARFPSPLPEGLLNIARRRQQMSLAELEKALRTHLESPTSLPVSTILQELSITPSYARYWLPELVEQLSLKHQSMQRKSVSTRRSEEIETTARVFKELMDSGTYPSIRKMSQALCPHKLSLQRAHLRDEYKFLRQQYADAACPSEEGLGDGA